MSNIPVKGISSIGSVQSIQQGAFSQQQTTEVILRWEAQRVRENLIYQTPKDEAQNPVLDELIKDQKNISLLLLKHPDMLKPFDKHVADCLLNFFIRTACPAIDQQQTQQQHQQNQYQNQNETLSKRCLYLFETAISNNIWPNAEIKFEYLEKILITLETVNNVSNLFNNTNVNQSQQLPSAQTSINQTQNQQQPNYSSICICIEIITFLIENSYQLRNKIKDIFIVLQRGLTACLMCTNSRVIHSMAKLIQTIILLMPVDFFNTNSSQLISISSSESLINSSTTSSNLIEPIVISHGTNQSNDPLVYLFGQPDGVLCKTILDSLSFYDKSSVMTPDSSLLSGTTLSLATNSSSTIEILTNCLIMLKAASSNNPQYIDRIMGPFMKILQKLYRDHQFIFDCLQLAYLKCRFVSLISKRKIEEISSQTVTNDTNLLNENVTNGKNSAVVCDLEINLCYSNLCGHNGQCLSLESGYRCLYDVGFTDKSCEFNLNQMKCCESPSNYFITTTTTSTLSYQNLIPNNSTSSHRQSSCTAVHSTPQHIFSAVSSRQNSNHICRSTSKCKNLILGGIFKKEEERRFNEAKFILKIGVTDKLGFSEIFNIMVMTDKIGS